MKKQVQSNVFIGVDVSKDNLDVAVGPCGESMRFANSEDGIALLADFLNPLTPALVLFEATGGWEMNAVRYLAAKRLPLVVINPRQVRDFAKATGQLAKTDHRCPHPGPVRRGRQTRGAAPETPGAPEARGPQQPPAPDRRDDHDQRNRLVTAPEWVRPDIEELIAILRKRLDAINRDLNRLIRKSPLWREKDKILQSVPGVGPSWQ